MSIDQVCRSFPMKSKPLTPRFFPFKKGYLTWQKLISGQHLDQKLCLQWEINVPILVGDWIAVPLVMSSLFMTNQFLLISLQDR